MPRQELIKCPKCGRPCWKPDIVVRTGNNPERKYSYYRYRHPLDRRTGRNKTCYVPVEASAENH
ncbi:MAG TPA: hypothetical protein VMS77_02170 [Conexivisphaerales archaeon]|nr:hypothetical protein [Conexivisphaerales archaeon]